MLYIVSDALVIKQAMTSDLMTKKDVEDDDDEDVDENNNNN